ncbi:MAG: hypothetical protein ACQESE_01130 [Nanobdellota archaeon]
MKQHLLDGQKAQIQLQFNWIFVIIIGAVLLGFFFSLTSTQTTVSEQRITAATARQLDTIITSTAQKSGTFKKFTNVPERELTFYCNSRTGLYHYEVDGIRVGTTKHDVLFTPHQFTPLGIYTWTLDWSIPYKMTTFTYLTHEDHMFIFYDDNPSGSADDFDQLYEPFPKNMTHVVYNKSTIADFSQDRLNYNDYTYVFFNNQDIPEELKKGIQGDNALVITITPQKADVFSYGNVTFMSGDDYSSSSAGENTPYFGRASLYGALFSGSKQLFECNMDKAYSYMHIVTLMQLDRVNRVIPYVNPTCNRVLGGIDDGIPRTRQHLGNISDILADGIRTQEDVKTLYDKTLLVEESNYKLAMQGNCPLIY